MLKIIIPFLINRHSIVIRNTETGSTLFNIFISGIPRKPPIGLTILADDIDITHVDTKKMCRCMENFIHLLKTP